MIINLHSCLFSTCLPLLTPLIVPFFCHLLALLLVFPALFSPGSIHTSRIEPNASVNGQTHERFQRTPIIRTKQNMQIFGVTPFIKLQKSFSFQISVNGYKSLPNVLQFRALQGRQSSDCNGMVLFHTALAPVFLLPVTCSSVLCASCYMSMSLVIKIAL